MFPFTEDLSNRQRNVSKGTNTCEYIVLHHTGVIGAWNTPTLLWENKSQVSCHFLIQQDGSTYKLWDPRWILWHCGSSQWDGRIEMNRYSLWIEVEWPSFTKEQRVQVRKLVQHLMWVYSIPRERVIRHKDIAPWRKIDPDDSLFGLSGFRLWRFILWPKKVNDR